MTPTEPSAPTSQLPVLAEGSEFAGYRVLSLLGRGGMGEVYEVEHLDLEERYALKVLNAEIADQEGARDRFRTEARVMAKLDHRNLVKVGECRETDGKLWLRMELAPGLEMNDGRRIVSLADLLDAYEGRPMKPDFVRGVLDGILAGLGAAHAADLIHRDLKPSNILFWPDGKPKISDFGLVRVVNQEFRASRIRFVAESVPGMGMAPAGSATRALLGSYEFMSPEQKRGLEADARSDLYAVGLMAFRMLTGHDTPGMEVTSSLVPGLDPKWDAWLVWMLKPDPRMRCTGVKEALAGLPGGDKPPPPKETARKSVARPLLFAAVVVGLCLAAWAIVGSDKPPQTHTVTVTEDAAVQRERNTVDEATAQAKDARERADKAEQERQRLVKQQEEVDRRERERRRKEKEDRDAAAEKLRLADLAKDKGPAAASKENPFKNSLEMRFVPIGIKTGGKEVLFSIWETRRQDYAAYAAAKSGVDATWKNVEFQGQLVGHEDLHPVVGVSYEDAVAFCVWLTEKEQASNKIGKNDTYRLPTDVEWSYAVGIGEREYASKTAKEKDAKLPDVYPWDDGKGTWPPPDRAGNYADSAAKAKFSGWNGIDGYDDGYATTAPVGRFPANANGLFDLSGNVWEWCGDYYDGKSVLRVLRGGSWLFRDSDDLLSSSRIDVDPGSRFDLGGFRCVLEVKSASTAQNQAQQPPSAAVSDDPRAPTRNLLAEGMKLERNAGYDLAMPKPELVEGIQDSDGGRLIRPPMGSPVWRCFVQLGDCRDYLHLQMLPQGKGSERVLGMSKMNSMLAGHWVSPELFVAYHMIAAPYCRAALVENGGGIEVPWEKWDIIRTAMLFRDGDWVCESKEARLGECWLVIGGVETADPNGKAANEFLATCCRWRETLGVHANVFTTLDSPRVENELVDRLELRSLTRGKVLQLLAVEPDAAWAQAAKTRFTQLKIDCYIKDP